YRRAGEAVGFEAVGTPGLELVTEYFEGWTEDISGVRRISELPAPAQRYVNALERFLGVPIEQVSLGPERSQLAT
ncbi:MAG: adenylosuccinate synthetase, partial [Candidatus Baltobacteraceae bacterium]